MLKDYLWYYFCLRHRTMIKFELSVATFMIWLTWGLFQAKLFQYLCSQNCPRSKNWYDMHGQSTLGPSGGFYPPNWNDIHVPVMGTLHVDYSMLMNSFFFVSCSWHEDEVSKTIYTLITFYFSYYAHWKIIKNHDTNWQCFRCVFLKP